MILNYFRACQKEPYRFFFPLGIIFLLWGALIWAPLLWNDEVYPVLAHRYLMLNGFSGCFIAGFLMTAIPRFSQTKRAEKFEVLAFFFVTLFGLFFAYQENESATFICSAF